MIDRSEVNRALAKAIAFKNVGNHAAARYWAAQLIGLLETAEILSDEYVRGEYAVQIRRGA